MLTQSIRKPTAACRVVFWMGMGEQLLVHRSSTQFCFFLKQWEHTGRLISNSVSWHRDAAAAALQEALNKRFNFYPEMLSPVEPEHKVSVS